MCYSFTKEVVCQGATDCFYDNPKKALQLILLLEKSESEKEGGREREPPKMKRQK